MKNSHPLLERIQNQKGQLAILIDPEKTKSSKSLDIIIEKATQAAISYFLVGGSTCTKKDIQFVVSYLKKNTTIPVVLFPGSNKQFCKDADGILYLSLLSGRNPIYLIEEHVTNALEVYNSNVEILPTAYLLIDGESDSSVQKISGTIPIKNSEKKLALKTSLAGVMQGKKIIFLDAGSGAKKNVSKDIILEIKKHTNTPIIIGGGINTTKKIINLKKLGVNLIVIGNEIEKNILFLDEIIKINSTKIDA
jgi:putative glycerol-1-phosphate prenyltransferase